MHQTINMPYAFGNLKTREKVMEELRENSEAYSIYLDMNRDFQEKFIQFCMGVRGVQMTYDPFFKYIFDAEVHPERLSELLSQIIGVRVKVKRALPKEHRRVTEKGSLLVMDVIVELENGELADVEIQKIGYLFPGQRAACYSSDMVMRQYEREKSIRGGNFTYKDLKKVYTVVIMEQSSREFHVCPEHYLHQGKYVFNTGLQMNLLQEFYFIPLDIFFYIEDNKENGTEMSELEAWLYFIGSDNPAHVRKVIASHPKFAELYQEILYFRYHPKEAVQMFSDALRILDENTVKYMVEEMKQELEVKEQEIQQQKQEMEKQKQELESQKQVIEELKRKYES